MTNKFLRDLDILEGNVADLMSESDTAQEAKRRGWTYHGYGYWEDSSGKVVGRTIDNKLVPISQSMSSTFTDVSVGDDSTKSASTTAAPKPAKKKATPKPIPISKYGQVTTFFQKMKSDAEGTVTRYRQGIKDLMSLPSIEDTVKAFPAFMGHPTIPILQLTPLEIFENPHWGGYYEYSRKTLKTRPFEIESLDKIRTRLVEVGIEGVVADCIQDPTRTPGTHNATTWGLAALGTIFHEYIHADDTLYHEHSKRTIAVRIQNSFGPTIAQAAELKKLELAFVVPNTVSNEFMVDHKARHKLRVLANASDGPTIPENQLLNLAGGYGPEMTAYYDIFDEAKVDKDELAEDMWESASVEERFSKLESALKTSIKVCIENRLKAGGIDVNSLSEMDAEIYSDIQDAFDDVSKVLEFCAIPNAGAQQFVRRLFEYLVHTNLDGSLDKKSVFKLRVEKPHSFDVVDDFLRVMSQYASVNPAIVQHMRNIETHAKLERELESIYKNNPAVPSSPAMSAKNRNIRKELVHDFLRKRRNRLGL